MTRVAPPMLMTFNAPQGCTVWMSDTGGPVGFGSSGPVVDGWILYWLADCYGDGRWYLRFITSNDIYYHPCGLYAPNFDGVPGTNDCANYTPGCSTTHTDYNDWQYAGGQYMDTFDCLSGGVRTFLSDPEFDTATLTAIGSEMPIAGCKCKCNSLGICDTGAWVVSMRKRYDDYSAAFNDTGFATLTSPTTLVSDAITVSNLSGPVGTFTTTVTCTGDGWLASTTSPDCTVNGSWVLSVHGAMTIACLVSTSCGYISVVFSNPSCSGTPFMEPLPSKAIGAGKRPCNCGPSKERMDQLKAESKERYERHRKRKSTE